MMKRTYEIIIISILFFCVIFIYSGQQRITLNNGQGWDGTVYYKVTEQIQQGVSPIVGPKPYIKRVGNFYLVSVYSKITNRDLMESALHVDIIGMFIVVILLLFWLRIYIDAFWIRTLLILLFMTAWFAPIRFSFYLPMASDAWGAVWFMGGLLLLDSIRKSFNRNESIVWKIVIFSLVVAVGNLFRESNIVLAVALFFIFNPLKYINLSFKNLTISHGIEIIKNVWTLYFVKRSIILFLPIIMVVVLNSIVFSKFVTMVNDGTVYAGYIYEIAKWFYTKSLPEYFLGVFNAYGPLILLTPFYYKIFKSFFRQRQDLLFLLFISFLFGYIGGADTERILFMSGFPIVLVLIGMAIKNVLSSKQRWWLYILLFLQTIAYRFYWFLPDFPNEIDNKPIPFFTVLVNDFQISYVFAQHGNINLNTILFMEYMVLFMVTFYVIHNKINFPFFKSIKN